MTLSLSFTLTFILTFLCSLIMMPGKSYSQTIQQNQTEQLEQTGPTEQIYLIFNDQFSNRVGEEYFSSTDTLMTVKEIIKNKIHKLHKTTAEDQSWDIKLYTQNRLGKKYFLNLSETLGNSFESGSTIHINVIKHDQMDGLKKETVKNVYDPDVAPVLRSDLENIIKLLDKDKSQLLMIGIASCNFSADHNQQFPEFLREKVEAQKIPVTIMLIDGAFANPSVDSFQIYKNQAFKATHWTQLRNKTKAKEKVRVFTNQTDFKAKVTIRVYGTNVLSKEWSHENNGLTLLGNIELERLEANLNAVGKSLIVGDFHRTSYRPDIYPQLP